MQSCLIISKKNQIKNKITQRVCLVVSFFFFFRYRRASLALFSNTYLYIHFLYTTFQCKRSEIFKIQKKYTKSWSDFYFNKNTLTVISEIFKKKIFLFKKCMLWDRLDPTEKEVVEALRDESEIPLKKKSKNCFSNSLGMFHINFFSSSNIIRNNSLYLLFFTEKNWRLL